MKKIFVSIISVIFFLIFIFIFILSTIGYETNKFNKIISDKINSNNKNISLRLKTIQFKFDIKNLSLFLLIDRPGIEYRKLDVPIKNIKVYLNPLSLIKSNIKINKIFVTSDEFNISELKKIISKTKPSNLNSFIYNKIKNGKLNGNVEFYLNDAQGIDNFIARGEVREMDAILSNELIFRDTSFNFFADSSDILIKNIASRTDILTISEGDLQVKKDRNKDVILKSNFKTRIKTNKKNIIYYLSLLKDNQFINSETYLNANLNHFLNISLDKTFKVTNYVYSNNGKVNDLFLKLNTPLNNQFLEKKVNNLHLKNFEFKSRLSSDKKNEISATGTYSIDDKIFRNFNFKNNFTNKILDINLDFDFFHKLHFNLINYKKDNNKIANISVDFKVENNLVSIKNLEYKENKNSFLIENLKFDKIDKAILSLKGLTVKTFDENNIKNDFKVSLNKQIMISGSHFDAFNLNKILNQKSKNNILKRISKSIDINIQNIETPLSKKLSNFKLIGDIKKGDFIKILAKGEFENNKFLDISMKDDQIGKKNI